MRSSFNEVISLGISTSSSFAFKGNADKAKIAKNTRPNLQEFLINFFILSPLL